MGQRDFVNSRTDDHRVIADTGQRHQADSSVGATLCALPRARGGFRSNDVASWRALTTVRRSSVFVDMPQPSSLVTDDCAVEVRITSLIVNSVGILLIGQAVARPLSGLIGGMAVKKQGREPAGALAW
jgi:hypothetical protein